MPTASTPSARRARARRSAWRGCAASLICAEKKATTASSPPLRMALVCVCMYVCMYVCLYVCIICQEYYDVFMYVSYTKNVFEIEEMTLRRIEILSTMRTLNLHGDGSNNPQSHLHSGWRWYNRTYVCTCVRTYVCMHECQRSPSPRMALVRMYVHPIAFGVSFLQSQISIDDLVL